MKKTQKLAVASFVLLVVSLSAIQYSSMMVQAQTGQGTEEIWLDTYTSAGEYPTVFSTNPLEAQKSYKVTIQGTWSNWPSTHWTSQDDPPVGSYEQSPMYPGQDGGEKTGIVGQDAFWGFACVFGEDYTRDMNWWPLPGKFWLKISLDNGASWTSSIRPTNDVYTATHNYEIIVAGQDAKIGVRIPDLAADDNYGLLKIRVESYSEDTSIPAGGLPLGLIIALILVIAIVAVLLIFIMLKRRKPRSNST